MSSIQTGQLIALLGNTVLMVIIAMMLTLIAWLRWHWLQTKGETARVLRRRCRWAYFSFVLAAATLLGMVTSLGVLTLRTVVAVNALVTGAMAIFLLSIVLLIAGLGLWFIDVCYDLPTLEPPKRARTVVSSVTASPVALLPAAIAPQRRSLRRTQRRQRSSKQA